MSLPPLLRSLYTAFGDIVLTDMYRFNFEKLSKIFSMAILYTCGTFAIFAIACANIIRASLLNVT